MISLIKIFYGGIEKILHGKDEPGNLQVQLISQIHRNYAHSWR